VCLLSDKGVLKLPLLPGSGEESARLLMRERLGSAVGELKLAGVAPVVGRQSATEVWIATRVRRDVSGGRVEWLPLEEVEARAGSPALRDPATLAAFAVAWGSGILRVEEGLDEARRPARHLTDLPVPVLPPGALDTRTMPPEQFLNPEVSLLDFNLRVLEMAEDRGVPLLERLSYLSIVGSNLDELYMVRVGSLKVEALQEAERLASESERTGGGAAAEARRSLDGLTAGEQLASIALRARTLLARLDRALNAALSELAAAGIRLARWEDLGANDRAEASRAFREEVFPILTPRAVTISPGHPTPLVPSLAPVLAVVVEDLETGPSHLTYLRLARTLPRFRATPAGLLPLEDLVRAHLDLVYPGRRVEQAFLFRVTRGAELDVEEEDAGDLLQAIAEEARGRARNAVVRLECERGMPPSLRARLLKELRFEKAGDVFLLTDAEVHEGARILDLRALRELVAASAPSLPEAARHEPFTPRETLDPAVPLWDQIRRGDRLVHHPYESFDASVVRFFREAAADPDVLAVKTTLYRAGDPSPVAEALCEAARAGKEVAAFVELKARFDEERNVSWVKRLEEAGAQVVYGLVGLKNHAKLALVVRREAGGVARYVHAGTGNYNAATARLYTDLGLFTARGEIGADAHDLFNELMGSSKAPNASFRRLLVAPRFLQPALLERLEREAEHARAGRPAGIRAKMNGLTDARVIQALYRASQAGVPVELVVRGLCMLRPGVTGLSESVRVLSILGRFLEHARIWRFENGGTPETFLASADWRPRNLRRRVELAVPVEDPGIAARLERLLELELADPRAWELGPHGAWLRRSGAPGKPTAQEILRRDPAAPET
jgi:polyphosphate kinase